MAGRVFPYRIGIYGRWLALTLAVLGIVFTRMHCGGGAAPLGVSPNGAGVAEVHARTLLK